MNSIFKLALVVVIGFVGLRPGATPKPDPSIYELSSRWKDIEGQSARVSNGKGSHVLIAMVYTSCAHACPMIISKIQEIETALKAGGLKGLKMVIASFDVKNDRPAKLKAYVRERNLDPEKWIFLSPDSDSDARELAVTLGISYKDLGNGDFSHSNVISLLDPNGVVIAKIDSLTASHEPFLKAIGGKK